MVALRQFTTNLFFSQDFRGEGGPWYEEVLDSMMIANCNENTDKHERYVDCEEESADQEEQAGDFDGGGLCEVKVSGWLGLCVVCLGCICL